MKKKFVSLIMALAMAVTMIIPSGLTLATEVMADDTESFPVHLTVAADNSGRMPTGMTLEDASYDRYFGGEEGDAAAAVPAILAAGKLSINGTAFPATLAEYNESGFSVNGSAVSVSAQSEEEYAEAAVAAATKAVPIGNTITLTDTDGDGAADEIAYDCYAAFVVNKITETEGGYIVERAAIDGIKPYDGQKFAAGNTTVVKSENMASDIQVGDMALARLMGDEWVLIRAYEANGILVDGADHQYYQIDDVKYDDAMRFSRDDIVISNRCGEYTNAQKYFGFANSTYKVSLWLVPVADDCETTGAPAGFTSNENGKVFLKEAISQAQAKLDSVTVSTDGSDVEPGSKWVSQEAYDELDAAIKAAEKVLEDETVVTSDCYDYQVYVLYLVLHGSGDDIGAKYAGYDYTGFDNEMADGTKEDLALDTESAELATKETLQLTANKTVESWTSSDEKIATVDENGLVTAVRYGKVTITATAGDESASCEIQTRYWDVNGSSSSAAEDYQYFYKPVYWAADATITQGYDNVYFGVGQECTREDFVLFLYRLAGKPSVKASKANVFTDVASSSLSSTFKKAIAWAADQGITKGYKQADGTYKFGVGESIARKDAVIMLYRYAGSPAVTAKTTGFTDVDGTYKTTSDTFKAIAWAKEKNITKGLSAAQAEEAGLEAPAFGCSLSCAREQMITFIYRLSKLK